MEIGYLITIIVLSTLTVLTTMLVFSLKASAPEEAAIRQWAKNNIRPHIKWIIVSIVFLSTTFVFIGLWIAATEAQMEVTTIEPDIEIDEPEAFGTVKLTGEITGFILKAFG